MVERKVFTDSVTPLPDQGPTPHGLLINAASAEHADETMRLLFSIAMPAASQAELEDRVARGEVVPLDPGNLQRSSRAGGRSSLFGPI